MTFVSILLYHVRLFHIKFFFFTNKSRLSDTYYHTKSCNNVATQHIVHSEMTRFLFGLLRVAEIKTITKQRITTNIKLTASLKRTN